MNRVRFRGRVVPLQRPKPTVDGHSNELVKADAHLCQYQIYEAAGLNVVRQHDTVRLIVYHRRSATRAHQLLVLMNRLLRSESRTQRRWMQVAVIARSGLRVDLRARMPPRMSVCEQFPEICERVWSTEAWFAWVVYQAFSTIYEMKNSVRLPGQHDNGHHPA